MIFQDCLIECCHNQELIKQFNRLAGTNVLAIDTRPPVVKMIDEATGYQKVLDEKATEDLKAFTVFVFECVWMPLIEQDPC
jgi:hypothetical protein